MKQNITIESKDLLVWLASDIVFGQRKYWNGAVFRTLYLSLMRPIEKNAEKKTYPLLIWLCGGGFTEMDRNIYLPELVWFAKHGFVVACLDYSTFHRIKFPENAEDVKLGIRFLKAHKDEFNIDITNQHTSP